MNTNTETTEMQANMCKLQKRMHKVLKTFCTLVCALNVVIASCTDVFAAELGNSIKLMEINELWAPPTSEMSYADLKSSYEYSDEEILALYRTVQGEAGAETLKGKTAVAAVVLNRFFGDNGFKGKKITDIVYSPSQFAPCGYNMGWFAKNNPEVIVAVKYAIQGFDPTAEAFPDKGALYFFADWNRGKYGVTTIKETGTRAIIIDRQCYYN